MTAPVLGLATGADARIDWLDRAKGLGILLVVLGHALGGLIDSPVGAGEAGYRQLFFLIYSFHMPLFFLLSALLVAPRLEKDRRGFTESLFTRIAWPYFLWSTIQFSIIYALGTLVNQPVERWAPTILSLPVKTVSQFWFLHALFLLHLLSLALLRPFGPIAFLLLCLGLKPLALLLPLPEVLRLAANQAPFYGLGVALGVIGIQQAFIDRSVGARLGLAAAAVALALLALDAAPPLRPDIDLMTAPAAGIANLAWQPAVLPAALAGTGAAIALASLAGGRAGELLALLGRRSMAIFLLHVLAVAGTRIVLANLLGVTNPHLILPASFAAGIVAPLVAYALARRVGATRLLGLG
jgi:fucose 4-O-acetylase-like acetyltransferase